MTTDPDLVRALMAKMGDINETLDRDIEASGEEILADPGLSHLVDEPDDTIRDLADSDLKKLLIQELLLVTRHERLGKPLTFRPKDFVRFLPADLHDRVDAAYNDPFIQSLLTHLSDGQVRLHPDHLQDAMDFCGMWLDGHPALGSEGMFFKDPVAR